MWGIELTDIVLSHVYLWSVENVQCGVHIMSYPLSQIFREWLEPALFCLLSFVSHKLWPEVIVFVYIRIIELMSNMQWHDKKQ